MDGWFPLGGLHVNGYFVCMGLCGKILRSVVGAVPVCPPVSLHKGASIIHPRAQYVYFWYGNAATRTFGRAHRHRPYAFCLRELRVDVCPYGFVWADCTWTVDFVWVDDVCVWAFVGVAFSMGSIGRNSFILLIFAMS